MSLFQDLLAEGGYNWQTANNSVAPDIASRLMVSAGMQAPATGGYRGGGFESPNLQGYSIGNAIQADPNGGNREYFALRDPSGQMVGGFNQQVDLFDTFIDRIVPGIIALGTGAGLYSIATGAGAAAAGGTAASAAAPAATATTAGTAAAGTAAAVAPATAAGSATVAGTQAASLYGAGMTGAQTTAFGTVAGATGSNALAALASGATPTLGTIGSAAVDIGSMVTGGGGSGSPVSTARSIFDIVSGIYGMKLADDAREASDPFAQFRGAYGQQLAALEANPSLITSRPGWQAGLEAISRNNAARGYAGSGNETAVLSRYAGDFYNQEANRLAQLAGAGQTPGAGQFQAAQLASQSLGSIGYGLAPIIPGGPKVSQLFGTPNGFRTYDRDQAELAQLSAATADTRAATAEREATAALRMQQAASLKAKEEAEAQELEFIRIALAGGSPTPDKENPLEAANRVGAALIQSGRVNSGVKVLDEVAAARQKLSSAEANAALEERRRVQTSVDRLDFIREVFSGVRNEADYSRALMTLGGSPIMQGESLDGLPPTYDPQAVASILAGSEAQARKRRLELEASNVSSQIARRNAQTANDALRTKQLEARTNAYVERQKAVGKTGGDRAVPAPTLAERADVTRTLKQAGIQFDGDDVGYVAAELASEAKLLHRRLPQLTYQAALTQVIEDAKTRGDLKPGEPGMFGLMTSSPKFSRGQGSFDRPITDMNAALKPGAYYRTAAGEVYRAGRDGKITLVTKGAPTPDLQDEEEDEE